jgi:hypothetical protein
MDYPNPNYDDFFLKGYVHGKFSLDVKHFEDYNYPDANNPNADSRPKEARSDLTELHLLIGQEYINKIFGRDYILKESGMWEGVDNGSHVWHNDAKNGKEFNTNFLIYMDENEIGLNSIGVRNKNDEHVIFPMKYDFMWLNQSSAFEHKASHNGGRRRVLSFEYKVYGLNN